MQDVSYISINGVMGLQPASQDIPKFCVRCGKELRISLLSVFNYITGDSITQLQCNIIHHDVWVEDYLNKYQRWIRVQ